MAKQRAPRAQFSTRFGLLAAAAGSAIGLGNIWKFPYITGENGGAAFLFVYLGFILAIGLPIMLSELIIGRMGRQNAYGAFRKLAPGTPWKIIGSFGVTAAFLILAFYGVVAGWSIKYIVLSVTNAFEGSSSDNITAIFDSFMTNPLEPVYYQIVFMILTAGIVIIGVHKGIERYSKLLMPVLLLIIIVLDIKALSLPGAGAGLKFLFEPKFSELTMDGVLTALGHAFFSLSLGMGTLITYGSYVKKNTNLVSTAVQITFADTIIAILAAIAIFPAVFHYGFGPAQQEGLIFRTLPMVFQKMTGGYVFSIVFFVLLTIAALTSAISILEVVVAYFTEELKINRKLATILAASLITLLGVLCSLSMGVYSDYTILGFSFFGIVDFIASNLLLPLGGMFIALFIGWYLGKNKVMKEVAQGGNLKGWLLKVFMILVKFIAPVAIFIVFLQGLIEKLS